MRFLILFISVILSFSYELIVLNKKESEKLNTIGFNCSKKDKVYSCLESNDINELKRIKEFLKTKFKINAQIVSDIKKVQYQKVPKSKSISVSKKTSKPKKINPNGGYCIQVGSFKELKNAKKVFNRYKNLPLVRIENIGGFYVLRIGEGNYNEIKSLSTKVKGVVRKCNLVLKNVLISNFNNEIINSNISSTTKKGYSNADNILLNSTINSADNSSQNSVQLMYNYLNSGDLINAKKLALNLRNRYPTDANLVLGIVAMKQGDFKNACSIFSSMNGKRVLKLKKDACYTYDIKEGFRLVDTSPTKALFFFNKALKYKPNSKDALLGKAYAYTNLKNYQKAYKIFKNLYNKYPNDKKILEGYINILYLLKKFDELEKLKATLPDTLRDEFSSIDFYMKLKKAQKLLDEKQYLDAERILTNLYIQKPDDVNVLLALANLYLQTGQLDKSLNFFKNVLLISPSNIYALRGLEVIYMKKGDYQKAMQYSDRITALGFKDKAREKIKKFYYIQLAQKYLKENNLYKAKEVLKKAYDIDKKDPLILSLLGDIAFKENNNDLAYLYYAKSYAAAPDNFGITLKFLYALLKLNLFDQIKIILSRIDTSHLNDKNKALLRKFYVDLYAKYATYLLNNKDYNDALAVVNDGLLMESDNYSLLSTKAWICFNLKQYECAIKYFRFALAKKNDDKLKYGLALAYLNSGNKNMAKKILDSIHTNDRDLRVKIAGVYVRLGEIDKAKRLLRGVNNPSIKVRKQPIPLNREENYYHKEDKFFPNPFLNNTQPKNTPLFLGKVKKKIDLYPVKKKIVLKNSTLNEYEFVQNEISNIEQDYISNIRLGVKIRSKSGESGLSRLSRASFPYLEGEYFLKNKQKLVFILNNEFLNSGDGNKSLKTKVGGISGKIGYEQDNFKIHIGTTPLGTDTVSSTVIGDISGKIKKNLNTFYINFYRDSLKDSLTSYVGNIKDNEKFSRVIQNGMKLGYKRDLDNNGSFVYVNLAFNYLNGKNINDNSEIESELLYLNYIGDDFLDKNFLGFYINLAHYKENNYYFYPPYGGYFSPKLFLLSMPRYEGYLYSKDKKFISKLTVMVGGSYINNWSKTNTNFVYDIEYSLEYLFLKKLAVEGGVDFRNSTNYNDVFFTLMFRYYFGNKKFFKNKDIDEFSQKVINW